MSPIEAFLISLLATWRVSHLVWAEDGPWDVFAKLRSRAAGYGWRVFDCFYCLSLWVALSVAACAVYGLGEQPRVWNLALQWLALSGGAILLERVTTPTVGAMATSAVDTAAAGTDVSSGQAPDRPDEHAESAAKKSIE
jgi:hypothetical protein